VPWRDRLGSYRVLVDGAEVGRLRSGETIEAEIASGSHVLSVKVDWVGSPEIQFATDGAEICEFECRAGLLRRLFSRHGHIDLDRRVAR
jgi:hypothetical protein